MGLATFKWSKYFQEQAPEFPMSFTEYLIEIGEELFVERLNSIENLSPFPDALFKEFNGAFIESFIAQQLASARNEQLFYWTSRSDAEVDFILDSNQKIFLLEVKSGTSRNTKGLQSYASKFYSKCPALYFSNSTFKSRTELYIRVF